MEGVVVAVTNQGGVSDCFETHRELDSWHGETGVLRVHYCRKRHENKQQTQSPQQSPPNTTNNGEPSRPTYTMGEMKP